MSLFTLVSGSTSRLRSLFRVVLFILRRSFLPEEGSYLRRMDGCNSTPLLPAKVTTKIACQATLEATQRKILSQSCSFSAAPSCQGEETHLDFEVKRPTLI